MLTLLFSFVDVFVFFIISNALVHNYSDYLPLQKAYEYPLAPINVSQTLTPHDHQSLILIGLRS